jgi:hypothetical protein
MAELLPVEDVEALWNELAVALTAAGPSRERLLLAKLVLLLARRIGDRASVSVDINEAMRDLERC